MLNREIRSSRENYFMSVEEVVLFNVRYFGTFGIRNAKKKSGNTVSNVYTEIEVNVDDGIKGDKENNFQIFFLFKGLCT